VATRQRLTREEKKARTRERLLEAAAKVFARKGFGATSVDEVAEEAGLTKGAVYSNFDSKEDLVRAVLDERQQRMLDIGPAVHEGSIQEKAAEASALFSSVAAQERDSFLLFLEFAAYAVRNPDVYPEFLAAHREAQARIAGVIEQYGGDGTDEPTFSAAEQALIFDAVGTGIAFEKLINPEVSDDLIARLLAVVWAAFNTGGDRSS
jgi:AcrR family transcriptional regulator